MKFGRIFPPSPDFLNQCGFWLFLSPESSAAARDCCVSSGTAPSKGLDHSEEQIRKLVPPCGNITASSLPNATLVQPSKQRCWLMSEAKTNKAKDNFNGASIKGSKTQRKQGACVWSYAEKQGNSNRGRGCDFLLPKLRRKTSRHKSGSFHHPRELTGNKPSSSPAARWQCSCWLQGRRWSWKCVEIPATTNSKFHQVVLLGNHSLPFSTMPPSVMGYEATLLLPSQEAQRLVRMDYEK